MIARLWRGWTFVENGDTYVEYLGETGMKAHRATPGNRGAWILRRRGADRVEFLTLSFWDSPDATRFFAGDDAERAVFYPEDDRFLIDRERRVHHYEVVEEQPH